MSREAKKAQVLDEARLTKKRQEVKDCKELLGGYYCGHHNYTHGDIQDLLATIDKERADNKRLKEALRPFAGNTLHIPLECYGEAATILKEMGEG